MLLETWKEFEVNNDEFIFPNDPKPQLKKKGENSRESSAYKSLNAWNTRETPPWSFASNSFFPDTIYYFWFLTKLFIIILFINQDEHGDDSAQEKIKKKMPRRVKKRRKVQTDDGVSSLPHARHATLGIVTNQNVHDKPPYTGHFVFV